jgi:2-iminobutanoate/2-iminopropanoate deaminase
MGIEEERVMRAAIFVAASVVTVLGLFQSNAGQLPEKKFITKDGKKPKGLFTSGVMVDKTLYIAGKGDYRPDAAFPEKVKNSLNEVKKVLQMAGLDMRHVVHSFVYLEDHSQFAEYNKQYAAFFDKDPPARTTLGVSKVPGESHLEITCIAYGDLAGRNRIGEVSSGLPFSPGILAGDTLYISGKGDQLPDGQHPPTFEAQVRQALRNVETTLTQAGLDFRHVVMSHVFLDKQENLEVTNKVYKEFFKAGDEPACATVFVDWIPGGSHVEVTCIATTALASRKVVRPTRMKTGEITASVTGSPGVWAGNTLYLSGLPGFKPQEQVLADGLKEQVHQMARNHVDILETTGLKLDDIVSGHVYLRDIKDYQALNGIYREYFSRGPGVRTCLMPTSRNESKDVQVRASFIAARTR